MNSRRNRNPGFANMAAATQLQALKEEATCSVCLEYFKDPVSLECGHNFCQMCITRSWEGLASNFPCPRCRESSQVRVRRPNKQLASLVEIAKQWQAPEAQEEQLCEEHEERLKLFCEDDRKPICVLCDRSKAHKAHTVIPIQEALRKYKGKVQDCLMPLRRRLREICDLRTEEKRKPEELKANVTQQRQKLESDFEALRKKVAEELRQLSETEEEILQKLTVNLSDLSAQNSAIESLITEITEKCQQPPAEFLKDVCSTLNRCAAVNDPIPAPVSIALKKTSSHWVTAAFRKLRDKAALPWISTPLGILFLLSICLLPFFHQRGKVHVTLDPDSAHLHLVLSEDRTRVRYTHTAQPLPDNPGRFTNYYCVLGSEGFTSGRHYWELQLQLQQEGKLWSVGVAGASVSRKGGITWSPVGEIWALEMTYDGQYRPFTVPQSPMALCERPRKLGVYLDYEKGQLSLHNADTMEHLYTFTQASFTKRVFPFFCLNPGVELSLV